MASHIPHYLDPHLRGDDGRGRNRENRGGRGEPWRRTGDNGGEPG